MLIVVLLVSGVLNLPLRCAASLFSISRVVDKDSPDSTLTPAHLDGDLGSQPAYLKFPVTHCICFTWLTWISELPVFTTVTTAGVSSNCKLQIRRSGRWVSSEKTEPNGKLTPPVSPLPSSSSKVSSCVKPQPSLEECSLSYSGYV